ncbi:MAG TPA: acylphosphatase [Pseudogracilibacillus sp.]|nr:acylphosphatase [Pseudogracilibacillus sp.]
MDYSKIISLPQLTNEITKSARKTRLDAFAVAVEGWRRGLKLKWYTKDSEHFQNMIIFGVNPPGRLFSLSSEERTHYFFRTRGDKVTNEAVELMDDKGITKRIMEENDIYVPQGKSFSEIDTDEDIIAYSRTIDYPLVFKPTNASLGDGVVTNIDDEDELREAIFYVREELGYPDAVLEQHVEGREFRVYVVHDKVVAAYNRIAANITGDGESTIEELIIEKNRQRRKNARLNSCLIDIDLEILKFIHKKGYSLDSVPAKGEYLPLRQKTNVSSGGDPIDVTDTISKEMKDLAVAAVQAVPGLHHAGVDIIENASGKGKAPGYVIEINATAQIGGILYPLEGTARNIPASIIDYYFPETKGMDTTDSKVYFDMSTVLEPMESRTAMEVEVAPAPKGKLYAKRYVVKGDVQREEYHIWLRRQALKLGIHGHVNNFAFDEIEVIAASTDKQKVKQFSKLLDQYTNGSRINKIESEDYDEPITVGFEILELFNTYNLRSTRQSLRKAELELIRLQRKRDRLAKDIDHIETSTSWKITKLIRVLKRK